MPAGSDPGVVEEDQCLPLQDNCFQRSVDRWIDHSAHQITDPLYRELRWHPLLIRARRRQGVEDLHCPDDPGSERYLLAAETIGVAGTVPPLMMTANEADHLTEMNEWRQDLRSHRHMLLDVLELFFGKRTLFVENLFPDPDLADVVQPTPGAHRLDLLVADAKLGGYHGRQVGHPGRVAPEVRVLGLEGVDQRLQRGDRNSLLVGLFQPPLRHPGRATSSLSH